MQFQHTVIHEAKPILPNILPFQLPLGKVRLPIVQKLPYTYM